MLLLEGVLDLVERTRGKDVSEPQIRRPRVRQKVGGVAWSEDGRSRLDGPRVGADVDRTGPLQDEVNLRGRWRCVRNASPGGTLPMPMVNASEWVTSALTGVFR